MIKKIADLKPGDKGYLISSKGTFSEGIVQTVSLDYVTLKIEYRSSIKVSTVDARLRDGGTLSTGVSGLSDASTFVFAADPIKAYKIALFRSRDVLTMVQRRVDTLINNLVEHV